REKGQVRRKVKPLNFRKANFQLFKEIVNRIPWDTALQDKGMELSWQIFNEDFHRAQELAIPRSKKSGKERKRPAWLSREVLVKLKRKKQMHRQWKQGQVTWEEYKDEVGLCRHAVRKDKVKLELSLARDAKNNKKGFYRYVSQKRKPPINNTDKLETTDEETAELLNSFFASVFNGNLSSHTSQVGGQQDGDWGRKVPPTVSENQV
ncbi:hypothetical protein N302_13003, partial [Corvus brachyrhynchos]